MDSNCYGLLVFIGIIIAMDLIIGMYNLISIKYYEKKD